MDEAVLSPINDSIKAAEGQAFNSAMSNGSQVVSESGVYDAYGNAVATYGTAPSFGYVGQYRYYTDVTGLHYLKARYYNPAVGRFLSKDPIGYGGGINLYAYVENSPTNGVDPTGTFRIPWVTKCLEDAERKAWEMHERNDKLCHCYFNCRAMRCTGGGILQSYLIPWWLSRPSIEDDPCDREANRRGGSCARYQWWWPFNNYPDCYSCCKANIGDLPNCCKGRRQ